MRRGLEGFKERVRIFAKPLGQPDPAAEPRDGHAQTDELSGHHGYSRAMIDSSGRMDFRGR